ncbi:flagellar biosynthesis repressor FlbT [Phyllobacterium leguminum]|uniref:Probable flagellum biosynthesis repressor protein FlbT n=1 Tax=Phyllobacterium leguminum TaxID=314237 RepID=A0A318T4K4_9HYPH|nr:flagellar biosynthesis repressor FlbT [Phyllobacterium leguminum]PYE87682.1 flagellar protein FlbT [Phyllobacterium leguminum]
MSQASRNTIRLSLRAGEKIYINGAVLRADRKVSLELLNNATFLLESHVLQPEQTTTPLRQVYFAAQTMLIDPALAVQAREMFKTMLRATLNTFEDADILKGLKLVDELVHQDRIFEALKTLRGLYPAEAAIMDGGKREPEFKAQPAEAMA